MSTVYLIVLAINIDSRTLELDNTEEWAKVNNLTLNRGKSAKILIVDRKRKRQDIQPSSLPDIRQVSTIKILGVLPSLTNCLLTTMSAILSANVHKLYTHWQHYERMACATRLYKQSSGQSSSQGCYTPAAAGGECASSSDRQRITAFIHRGVRRGFCSSYLPSIEELVSDMDDKLFNCILSDKHHVPRQLLPPEPHCGYTLRPRKHELCLINKSRLDEQNFM